MASTSNNAFTLSGSTTANSTPSGGVSSNTDFLSLLAKPPLPSPTASSGPNSTLTATGSTMPSTLPASPYQPGSVSGILPSTSTPNPYAVAAVKSGSTTPYQGTSIVDYLNSVGGDSSYAHRAQLAAQYGISNYTGTKEQNLQLLGIMNKPAQSTPAPAQTQQNVTPPQTPIQPYQPPAQQSQPTQAATPAPVQQQQTPAPQPQAAPQQSQSADLSRSGVMGGLINATKDTSRIDAVNKQIADLRASLADQTAGINNEGIPLEFKQGRGQVLQTQEAQKEAALTGLLGAEVTARGQNITGLTSAAGLSQPIQVPYSNQLYQPDAQGNFAPAGGGNLESSVQGIAEKVKNGTMTYDQGISALSGYGQGGVNALQQALGSNFNVNQSNATGAVTQSQTQQVAQYKSALQQGQNLQNQLKDLITTFGINPNDVNAVNSGLQLIARNTSNPHYQQFLNYINDIANTYSQVLTPPGGSATDTTRGIASSMLNATASGASIIDTMKALDNAAQAKIAGVPTTGNQSGGGTMFGSFF